MNEEAMRKHYERTSKETLINILISSREQVEKLQNRNKERKQEIEILKAKWDKLKKWANEPKVYICHYHILDKMNEIEQGVDKE